MIGIVPVSIRICMDCAKIYFAIFMFIDKEMERGKAKNVNSI